MNDSKTFFISHNGVQEGPMTLSEIAKRIEEESLSLQSYLYEPEKADWTMLVAYPDLAASLKPATVDASKAAAAAPPLEESDWFVLKGENKFGPFAQSEVVRLLQDKKVLEHDYVWHAKLTGWELVANVPDFSPDSIRALKQKGISGINEGNFRRRHARVELGASLLVHNNKTVFKGKTLDVSAAGAALLLETTGLKLGDELFIHFKPGTSVPPFHARCTIVTKKSTAKGHKYGVKFTKLNAEASESLKTYTSGAVKAA